MVCLLLELPTLGMMSLVLLLVLSTQNVFPVLCSWQLQFILSEFRGQLPKPFAKGPMATRIIPTDMNDQNKEEPSRYVSIYCWFLSLTSLYKLN